MFQDLFSKREKTAIASTVLLFAATIILVEVGFFDRVPYTDIPAHFLGGFFLALFFIDYFRKALTAERGLAKDLLIILSASLMVGVAWEIFEKILTISLNYTNTLFRSGDIVDTLKDLVMDTIGASAMFFIVRHRHHRSTMFK